MNTKNQNKFAGVRISIDVKDHAWWAFYTVHYRGQVLNRGEVYVGDRFLYNADARAKSHCIRKANEWAKQNGFDGVVVR
jgi:hypothetical protein